MTVLHHNSYNNARDMMFMKHEVDNPSFQVSSDMYSGGFHQYNMDPSIVGFHNLQRTYPNDFGPHIFQDAQGFAQRSPSLHPHSAASPELHHGPLHSSLSSASGQSASSSAIGSPYSNHAIISPQLPQHWLGPVGLGLQPSIAGDYGYDYSFGNTSDPAILGAYGATIQSPMPEQQGFARPVYPLPSQSPAPSDMSSERSSKRIKLSQSPFLESNSTFQYPYTTADRRNSITSMAPSSPDSSSVTKNVCPFPECGKAFKDIKSHMLTHQLERPEKCPIATCDYHTKGFARKYDKNRHTLTHYKGTMVCGFCPGSGSSAEKSFNRADVFKRHLTSVHYVEQVPPNARRKTLGDSSSTISGAAPGSLAGYAPDATGKCSTCSAMFRNAQDFYEHLDDCVLRLVQEEEPSEAINAKRLGEVEDDRDVHDTLRNNNLPATTNACTSFSDFEEEGVVERNDEKDGDYATGRKSEKDKTTRKTAITKLTRKKRKEYPNSWGCPQDQMKMKKRVMCVFDGARRLWKDDMMMSSDFEVRVPLQNNEPRTGGRQYVTDLDVQTMKRAHAIADATDEEKGPWESNGLIEALMRK